MKQDIEEDIIIRKYLMGDLQQEEQLQVEERLFLDSEYLQTLHAVEDDLVDDYVYGELSLDERGRFEKHFLSTPERREALTVAKALRRHFSTNSLPVSNASAEIAPAASVRQPIPSKVAFFPSLRARQPIWRLALAAAVIIIAVCAVWFIVRNLWPANSNSPIQAQQPAPGQQEQVGQPSQESQQARDTPSNTNAPPPQEQSVEKREKPATGPEIAKGTDGSNNQARPPVASGKRPSAHVYSVVILPGGPTRGGGGETARVEFRSGPGSANLQMALLSESEFHTYSATLFADDNKPPRNWTGLKSTDGEAGKVVSIKVPTALLPAGTYHVKLRGGSSIKEMKDISTYYFEVLQR